MESNYFSALNDYFDEIYVLTLSHAKERQANIEKNLKGLNWRFFYGVDKKDLSLPELIEQGVYDENAFTQTRRTKRGMRLAEVACMLSHRNIMQDAVDKGHKRILIFEDDVLPCPERLANFSSIMGELPDDWDLVMLGHYDAKKDSWFARMQVAYYKLLHKLKLANWHKFDYQLFEYLIPKRFSKNFDYYHKAMGAHAYAITGDMAKKYIDFQTPVDAQADRIFLYYNLIEPTKGFIAQPPLFTLSELSKTSYIQIR